MNGKGLLEEGRGVYKLLSRQRSSSIFTFSYDSLQYVIAVWPNSKFPFS
jgi:hypothetical protein